VPLLIWAAVCLGYGLVTAIRQRNADIALAGVSAMVMHFGWSVGFWLQLLGLGPRRRVA
jgi:succinoglycan biosynthesis protein ExoA